MTFIPAGLPRSGRTDFERVEWLLERIKAMAASALAALGGATIQRGTGVLVNGASAPIPATITATSRIIATKLDALGGAGSGTDLSVPSATRVVGAPGSFIVQAVNADNTANAVDDSTFDWVVIN
jgi:hypothetical protein